MDELAFRAAVICSMLGSTTRYRVMKLLAGKRTTPGELCDALGKRPSVISHHLSKLRSTGLVRFRREATGLMYWPKPRGVAKLMAQIERFAAGME